MPGVAVPGSGGSGELNVSRWIFVFREPGITHVLKRLVPELYKMRLFRGV